MSFDGLFLQKLLIIIVLRLSNVIYFFNFSIRYLTVFKSCDKKSLRMKWRLRAALLYFGTTKRLAVLEAILLW